MLATRSLFALLVVVLWFSPLVWLFVTSFRSPETLFQVDLNSFRSLSMTTFTNLIFHSDFLVWLRNSVIISSSSAITTTTFSVLFVWKIYEYGRVAIIDMISRNLLLLAFFVPGFLYVFSLRALAIDIGERSFWFLVPAQQLFLFPVGVWIASGFMQKVSLRQIRLATMDGFTFTEKIKYVYFPTGRTTIFSVLLVSFILSFHDLIFPMVILNKESDFPLPLAISGLQAGDVFRWSEIAGAGVLATLFCIILLIVVRYMLRHVGLGVPISG